MKRFLASMHTIFLRNIFSYNQFEPKAKGVLPFMERQHPRSVKHFDLQLKGAVSAPLDCSDQIIKLTGNSVLAIRNNIVRCTKLYSFSEYCFYVV